MKKERLWISGLVILISVFILMGSMAGRITYENESRQAFVSVDMENLTSQGKNTLEHLQKLKDAGAQVVTVHPLSVRGLEAAGKLDLISYSSLSDSDNVSFDSIRAALGDYPLSSDHQIVLVTDASMREYLKQELNYRYNDCFIADTLDGLTTVVAFQDLTADNDLIVGYDYAELDLIKQANMSVALSYPSYTFEHEAYPEYFKQFVRENDVSFLILRNYPYDNKQPISKEFESVLRLLDLTLVVWGNDHQVGNEQPYLYDDFFSVMKYHTIRGFSAEKMTSHSKSGNRYHYYQWFNAALERNQTFIHTNILENPGMDSEGNFQLTLQEISDFTSNLKDYRFDKRGIDVPYSYSSETACMASGMILLSLVYLYLLLILKKTPPYFTEAYFGLMILTAILSYALASSLTGLYAVGITVVASGFTSAILFYLEKNGNGLKKYLWMILLSSAVMIAGAMSVSALLGGMEYYTATKLFYGSVISILLSFVFALVNGYLIYFSDTYSVKQIPSAIIAWCKRRKVWILSPIMAAVILAFLYCIIQIGNDGQLIPWADNFRQWLTDVFYIRPSAQEFLIGYPLLALFYYCSITKANMVWKLFTGVGSTILFVSVFDNFFHSYTAATVSMQRVWNGFLCGLIVSLAVVGILLLIRFMPDWLKQMCELKEAKEAEGIKETAKSEEQTKAESTTEPKQEESVLKPQNIKETEVENEAVSSAENSGNNKLLETEQTLKKQNKPTKHSNQNNPKNRKKQNHGNKPQNPKYPVKKSSKKKKSKKR